MVEPVTRQFADKDTGAPIIGGDYQLRDILGIDPPVGMTECTDPLYPGRYTADESLRPGIWAVQRRTTGDYADTGEHITVGPGWTFAGAIDQSSEVVPVELILGSVVNATAFVPLETGGAPTSVPTISHLQAAVDYAASAGIKRVYVGSYKGVNDWVGASALDLTGDGLDGIILDLGGARLKRTTPGGPVVSMVRGSIFNGTIEGSGADSVPEILSNTMYPIILSDINFPRVPTPHYLRSATVNFPTGTGAKAVFFNCTGHILARESGAYRANSAFYTRNQVSTTQCYECPSPNGEQEYSIYSPIFDANATAAEVGGLVSELIEVDLDTAPEMPAGILHFPRTQDASRALKHLWFTQNKRLTTIWSSSVIADRMIFPGAGKSSMTPAAIFAAHQVYGSEDQNSSLYWYKSGADITDSANLENSGVEFSLQSGIIVDKIYRGDAEKYEKIVLSLYSFFNPRTIFAISGDDPSFTQMVAWIPRRFTIPTSTLTDLLKDKDGSTMVFPESAIDVSIVVAQRSNEPGYENETVRLAGTARLYSGQILVDVGPVGIPLWDFFPQQLRRMPAGALSAGEDTSIINGVGVKLDITFNNRARTDLPRFF